MQSLKDTISCLTWPCFVLLSILNEFWIYNPRLCCWEPFILKSFNSCIEILVFFLLTSPCIYHLNTSGCFSPYRRQPGCGNRPHEQASPPAAAWYGPAGRGSPQNRDSCCSKGHRDACCSLRQHLEGEERRMVKVSSFRTVVCKHV